MILLILLSAALITRAIAELPKKALDLNLAELYKDIECVPSVLTGKPLSRRTTDVHVLMPIKHPKTLSQCIDLLLILSNRTFGDTIFEFGVNWDDDATKDAIRRVMEPRSSVRYKVHQVHNRAGDLSIIVNHLFQSTRGKYYMRFNDDTEMLTVNWNQLAVQTLQREPADFGIAWMTDLSNSGLQTHSFVSYRHKQIFGTYFPVHFKNWYEDNWITQVYPNDWRKQSGIRLRHIANGQRYAGNVIKSDMFAQIINDTRELIDIYCETNNMQSPFT